MKICAVIVAGGSGSRMKLHKNKVLLRIDGESIIVKSVRAFADMDDIVLVVRDVDKAEILSELQKAGIPMNNISFVRGGQTRGESVQNGLQSIVDCDIVLVHDAARPFVSKADIQRLIHVVEEHGAAILASAVSDTLKKVNDRGFICATVNRDHLYRAQTPQGFRFSLLRQAYQAANEKGIQATDDAALLELMGIAVKIVEASSKNIKITKQEDLSMDGFRVGHGFDVHRLTEGRKLILCGIDIPYEKGLLGHSDADVATHALMDAMLGAAALGDIGRHFPDTDERFRNADSVELLQQVDKLIRAKGYRLYQADITIIAQAPKMAPYIQHMRERLAEALAMDIDYINVKASTTEKLGFCGRGEGITCEAVCMLKTIEA